MIREFIIADLDRFEPNDYSRPDDVRYVFEDEGWWNYTLENSCVKAIVCFKENALGEWAVFALLSKYFRARDSVEMRDFMLRAQDVLKPKKLWTISKPIEKTSRWHRFFGFVFERPQEFQGETYNLWARVG